MHKSTGTRANTHSPTPPHPLQRGRVCCLMMFSWPTGSQASTERSCSVKGAGVSCVSGQRRGRGVSLPSDGLANEGGRQQIAVQLPSSLQKTASPDASLFALWLWSFLFFYFFTPLLLKCLILCPFAYFKQPVSSISCLPPPSNQTLHSVSLQHMDFMFAKHRRKLVVWKFLWSCGIYQTRRCHWPGARWRALCLHIRAACDITDGHRFPADPQTFSSSRRSSDRFEMCSCCSLWMVNFIKR